MAAPDPTPLARSIRGTVLSPGDSGWDDARTVWNTRFIRDPALVVRCEGADDVAAAVRFAREAGLPISVKGGGHDYAGVTVGEGSLLIDLGPMDSVEVDPDARRAVVGGGATWADVDRATTAHGLATPGGTCSAVGVGGSTLGGASGWLTRKHGLAVDNLRAAEVVTAAGDVVRASPDENPGLFWAIRGGGGNFGVVTSFEFELYPVEPVLLAGQVLYPVERARELLRFYRDRFRDAPDDLACYAFFLRVPPMEVFPEKAHGALALDFVTTWTGRPGDGEAAIAPFRGHGDPILDFAAPQPYVVLQQSFDAGVAPGNRWYSRSVHLDELSDEAIDAFVDHLEPFPGESTMVYFGPGGGAVGRVPVDATAYPHRTSAFELHVFPGWADPADDGRIMAWADALFEAMRPHGNGGVYVNLLGDGEEARVPEAYGPNWDRLVALKAEWDPDNVFQGNHNIPPAG